MSYLLGVSNSGLVLEGVLWAIGTSVSMATPALHVRCRYRLHVTLAPTGSMSRAMR